MALPLNPAYGPNPGWTVQSGDGGNQSMVASAGAAVMTHMANVTGESDTVTGGALNTLLGELQSAGLMKTS